MDNKQSKPLWAIYTFGTSFTKGGGFEFWFNPKLNEFYKDNPTPKLQFNFSWPGQLQEKILNAKGKTQVYNHAKSGYGHEQIIRKAFEIISSTDYYDDKLFIFEFGALGRKEYWHNELGWIVTNYHFKTDQIDFTHVINENDTNQQTITHGIAQTYFEDSQEVKDLLKRDEELFGKFNAITLNANTEIERISREIIQFLLFCNNLGVNYYVASAPFLHHSLTHYDKHWKDRQISYPYNSDNPQYDLYGFLEKHKLRIKDETNGFIDDGHGGFEGNGLIADSIFKRIINTREYMFPEK